MKSFSGVFPSSVEVLESKYGIKLESVYVVAHRFLSDKGEKAFHLSFDDRIFLSALGFQAKYGKFDESKTDSPGFFDFIGKRRIAQWQALGDMDRDNAMWNFVCTINKLCPLFLPYLEAHYRSLQNSSDATGVPVTEPQSVPSSNVQTPLSSPAFSTNEERSFILQNEAGIRAALNAQTREKFEQYAMEHYPDDLSKRQDLIAHLQDCHFHEYVTYIQQQYALAQQQRRTAEEVPIPAGSSATSQIEDTQTSNLDVKLPSQITKTKENGPVTLVNGKSMEKLLDSMEKKATEVASQTHFDSIPPDDSHIPRATDETTANGDVDTTALHDPSGTVLSVPPSDTTDVPRASEGELPGQAQAMPPSPLVRAPTMWTRGEINEFKESLADTKDAIVQVGCGEVITIRVPAYPAGSSIVWEFATDNYDIGFGLFFEWSSPESEVLQKPQPALPEDQSAQEQTPISPVYPPPLVDEIVPVYRRNSHQEIYCGSHVYPGLGTYLFKFDNSYSLWRSKTLYYRVYYTC